MLGLLILASLGTVEAARPTITKITPDHGPMAGGTTVVIKGNRFSGSNLVTSVTFGSTPAASFTVDSDEQITAVSPASSTGGAVSLTVENPSGSRSTTYTYDAPPTTSTPATTPPSSSTPATTPTSSTPTSAPSTTPASSATAPASTTSSTPATTSPTATNTSTTPTTPTSTTTETSNPPPPATTAPPPDATTTQAAPATVTVTVSAAPSNTTTGTGSIGSPLSEPQEVGCWVSIVPSAPGERVVVPFPPSCGVASVVVQLPRDTGPLNLSVHRLSAWPASLPLPQIGTPPALIFEAELRDASGAVVQPETAVVQVRVPTDWLTVCPADACRPELFHFHEGIWNRIRLQEVDRADDGLVMEGTTDGFSVFAVAGVSTSPGGGLRLGAWTPFLVAGGALAVAAAPVLLRRRREPEPSPPAESGPDADAKVSRLLQEMRDREELLQFVNNAAHDLANPLTPIQLQLDLLGQAAEARADDSQRKSLAIVGRNVEQLSLLIRDLRDAAKVQAGKLRLAPASIDLAAVARDTAESYKEQATKAGLELAVDAAEALPVQADAGQLSRVLTNFVNNAIKFTPPGGRITVTATREDDDALVVVRDTGAGLSAEDQERLFKPFSQVAGPSQEKGTGLGLFISKGIVEGHGGRIGCRSEGRGQGAAFFFTLAMSPPPAAATVPASDEEAS